ncbi:MAG: hypothetical protein ACYTF7_11360 [Planctomycetota bacterium]|jgi:hypothetical protein
MNDAAARAASRAALERAQLAALKEAETRVLVSHPYDLWRIGWGGWYATDGWGGSLNTYSDDWTRATERRTDAEIVGAQVVDIRPALATDDGFRAVMQAPYHEAPAYSAEMKWTRMHPYAGTAELVEYLRAAGCRTGIVLEDRTISWDDEQHASC